MLKLKNLILKGNNLIIIKNKKAELSELVRTLLWIILFIILSLGVYFLIKKLTNL